MPCCRKQVASATKQIPRRDTGRFCLSPLAEGRLMKFGTIGAGVVHFGRRTEMRIRQLRRMLNRNIRMD